MRTLKFRIWNGKEFTYSSDLTYIGLEKKSVKTQMFSKLATLFSLPITEKICNECTVQQWTGFKDSKEIDIYEGDIVKDTYYGDRTAKITFNLGCFWLDSNHLAQDLERELYDSTPNHLEVIGNVFKNQQY